jgi:PAS domain S-box-containing protein
MNEPAGPLSLTQDATITEDARTRRALLHMLEDLQRERDAIRLARRHWVATVDAVRDPMMVHDAGYRVVRCNRAYAAMAGMEVREIIGNPYWQMFPKLDGPLPGCRHVVDGVETAAEEEFRLPTGEVYISRSFPFAGGEGRDFEFLHVMRDVTERIRAKEALEGSERYFRKLIEGGADAFYVIDAAGTVIYRSPTAKQLTGWDDEEVVGRSITDFVAPEHVPLARNVMAATVRNPGEASYVELCLLRKDGTVLEAEATGRNLIGDPDIGGIVVTVRDITERKRSAEVLRDGEERYRAMFEQAAVGMIQTSLDGVLLKVNPALCAMLGYSQSELTGRHFRDITLAEDVAKSEALRTSLGAAESGSTLEKRYVRKDNSTMWANVSVAPVRGVDGKPEYFTTIVQDISRRKQADEDLRWRTAFFETLVKTSADGIIVVDSEGKKVVQNRRVAELWKIPREVEEDPDDNRQVQFVMNQTVDPKQFVDKVLHLYAHPEEISRDEVALKDGTILDRYSAPVLDREGRSYGRIWSFRDVTERRAGEEKLRTVNRALKTLSAGNEALVRATDEAGLLKEMIRILHEVGGYPIAFASYALDDADKTIEPKAAVGMELDALASYRATWADNEHGQSMNGRAIRLGKTQLVRDPASDPGHAAWRDLLQARNIRAVLGLPLRVAASGRPFGAIGIATTEASGFDADEVALLEELAGDLAYGIANLRVGGEQRVSGEKLRRSLESTIEAIAATMETRDPYTAGHQRRVAALAAAIATEMSLPAHTVEGIHFGALIHDLGKIQVPAEILAKPTRLTKLEFELIKTHSQAGYDIIKGVEFPWPVGLMVLQHHERLDGSGYPQGLKGDAIAPEARILAVADVVEAMSSHRPYRAGLGIDAALKEVEDRRGTWFEPQAVDACLRLFREKGFAFATR